MQGTIKQLTLTRKLCNYSLFCYFFIHLLEHFFLILSNTNMSYKQIHTI